MTPRVSVILPTRDRLRQLQHALASVAAQGYRDVEVLVVDDGSTDGTRTWLAHQGSSVRVVSTDTSRGAAAARNRGIERARGDLIAFLDDDDVWRPAYLEAQVEHLDANPTAALSYADHLEVDAIGRASHPDTRALLAYDSPLVRMLAEGFIHTMSVVVCRRSVFDRLGLFSERLSIVHDWEWYARVLASGAAFTHLARPLVGRAVPGGLVTRHRPWFDEERQVIDATFAAGVAGAGHRRLVRAYRSLFFAHLALSRGDVGFGLLRLADAFLTSPWSALRVAARRLIRRVQLTRRPEPWDAAASATP